MKVNANHWWVYFAVGTMLDKLDVATAKDALLDKIHHSIILTSGLTSIFIGDWDALELGKSLFH